MNTIAKLKEISLFSFLDTEVLEKLKSISILKNYISGEHVFREGEPGQGFFGIISGRVKIYKNNFEGKEQILHLLGPGDIFAEVVLGGDFNYPANSLCLEDSTLVFIPKEKFKKLFQAEPDLALKMIWLFSLRLKELVQKVEDLSLKEVPQRLALYLYSLALDKQKKVVRLETTKSELAYLLGTIPETLSRAFKSLKEQGLLLTRGKDIEILDPESLKAFAQLGKHF
ncbi:MAG: family transcriptional regulator, dissimilatory nitrate respiration regulator [Desulfonauticus sp.]|jgi:CRP/FNR family transcriptional regulator|nr:family transcriptional regulator, dissimilatory nitrate respiration regulator [Desulfonauticus sp.]